MKLIRNSILSFLLIYLGYNVFLTVVKPEAARSKSLQKENLMTAQEFLDFNSDKPFLIVGSSLSSRLRNSYLPDYFFNLSFSGGSLLTGLEIIAQSPNKPKVVFIEMNVAVRGSDTSLVKKLFTPGMSALRRTLPAMSEKYQPVNLLWPLVYDQNAGTQNATTSKDLASRKQQLQNTLKDYVEAPKNDILMANIRKMKSTLSELKSNGVKVYLYMIPVNCQVKESLHYKTLASVFSKEFPNDEYQWLPQGSCDGYVYTDGIHFTNESAKQYTDWFLAQVQNISKDKIYSQSEN